MSGDREWERRVRLFSLLLLDLTDQWCRSDGDFPFDFAVSSTLYLFSSRCNPMDTPETDLLLSLRSIVESPDSECQTAMPNHSGDQRDDLVSTVRAIFVEYVAECEAGQTPISALIDSLSQQVVDTLKSSKYVVFHHTQTTSRDGGFHSFG